MRTPRIPLLAALAATSLAVLNAAGPNDWPGFGNDPGGMKFSPLTQITPANVTHLAVAWTYDTGEKGGGFRGWSVTPLVIDNAMYFATYGGKLVALDAATGAEIWKFDLKTISPNGRYSPRGISYWPGDAQTPPRIVATTTDGLLSQVNAKNGELVRIGEKGYVDLKTGMTERFGGGYNVAAPPAIFRDIAILAPATGEQGRYGIAGDIRGFDRMTHEEVNKTSRESEKACKALYDTLVQSGPYTPYGMVPSLVFPSSEGGGSWSGASFDPTRHLIVVNTRSLGTAGELRPSMSSGLLPSFGKVKIPFDDPDGYPCSAPPWGELMAINADTADTSGAWRSGSTRS